MIKSREYDKPEHGICVETDIINLPNREGEDFALFLWVLDAFQGLKQYSDVCQSHLIIATSV